MASAASSRLRQPRDTYESVAALRDLLWLVVGIVAIVAGTAAGVAIYWWLSRDESHTVAIAGAIIAGGATALVAAAPYLVFIAGLRVLTDISAKLSRDDLPPVN